MEVTLIRGRNAGFTLIEVLVASAILATTASIVFGVFSGVVNSGKGLSQRAELLHISRFIVRKITEDIEAASLFPATNTGFFIGVDNVTGERESDEIRFTSFARRPIFSGTGSDQAKIRWFIKKPDDTEGLYTLFRKEDPLITAETEEEDTLFDAIDISNRVVSFNARYYVQNKFNDTHTTERIKTLPRAVEVTFTLEDDEGGRLTRKVLAAVGGAKL